VLCLIADFPWTVSLSLPVLLSPTLAYNNIAELFMSSYK